MGKWWGGPESASAWGDYITVLTGIWTDREYVPPLRVAYVSQEHWNTAEWTWGISGSGRAQDCPINKYNKLSASLTTSERCIGCWSWQCGLFNRVIFHDFCFFLTEEVEHCRRIGGYIHYLLSESLTLCMTMGMTTSHLNSQPLKTSQFRAIKTSLANRRLSCATNVCKNLLNILEYQNATVTPRTQIQTSVVMPLERVRWRTSATAVWVSTTKSQCRPLYSWARG